MNILFKWTAGNTLAVFFCLCLLPLAQVSALAESQTPRFKRGINVSRVFGFPVRINGSSKYAWPPFNGPLSAMTDTDLVQLKKLGLDFVRLSVDPGPFLESDTNLRAFLYTDLKNFILRLNVHGLKVLVDLHPATYASEWKATDVLNRPDSEKYKGYVDFIIAIVQLLEDIPRSDFALEIMNEPQVKCLRTDGEDWIVTQKKIYKKIRSVDSDIPLVLTGGCWSSIEGMTMLNPADYDAATMFDVHFYDPHSFTHQSLPWSISPLPFITALSYPSAYSNAKDTTVASKVYRDEILAPPRTVSLAVEDEIAKMLKMYYEVQKPDRKLIERHFSHLAKWANDHKIPAERIVIGEFGAVRWPVALENGSRERWLKDVRTISEDYGFGWALWDYDKVFGLVLDYESKTLDVQVINALGLNN